MTLDPDLTDQDDRQHARAEAQATLLVRLPDRTAAVTVEPGKTVVVGRGADADIVVDDSRVSRAQAVFRLQAGVLVVEDLGSRNGTRVGDRVLRGEAMALKSGDGIVVGSAEIVAWTGHRQSARDDFLEHELSQMLAANADASVLRVAFPDVDGELDLDVIEEVIGERGLIVPRSETEIGVLLAAADPTPTAAALRERLPRAVVTSTRVGKNPSARDLWRSLERLAATSHAPRAGVVVADGAMARVYESVQLLANAPTGVLLTGETGVGKEVVAESLHALSRRSGGPFVRLNCGAVPESLLESELFGHERGAFSGADRARPGLFEAADKGTIFLDEIGEMSLTAQVRLLRVLDQRTVTRIGSTKEIPIDVRLVSATHRDLQALIRSGKFRQDLFFRISTTTIQIPPLRSRPLEVPLLARHFADAIAARMALEAPWLDDSALDCLRAHNWPGNVRELKNAMEHAVVMASGGRITREHLPEPLRAGAPEPVRSDVKDRVASAEREAIVEALKQTGENRTHAAKLLGISRRTLVYKLARYGI